MVTFTTRTLEDLIMEVDPDYFKEIEEEKSKGVPLRGVDKRTERPQQELPEEEE